MATSHAPVTRVRGRLAIHADATVLYRGYEVKALGLTSEPTVLLVRTDESKEQHPIAAQDFLYVITGISQVSRELAERWFKAYLLARSMLSELVDLSFHSPEEDHVCAHSVSLAPYLTDQAEPFREAARQARALLHFLPHAAPVHPGEAAHLFAACLITTGRLENMLERFDLARLAPLLEQTPDGARFLSAIGRAQRIVAQVSELMGEETARASRQPTSSQFLSCLTFLLFLWFCLCAWQWLRQPLVAC